MITLIHISNGIETREASSPGKRLVKAASSRQSPPVQTDGMVRTVQFPPDLSQEFRL